MGIATVAVYSEADRDALHVELADEAVLHRPAAVAASRTCAIDKIIAACKQTGARGRASGLRLPVGERGVRARASRRRASSSSARSTRRSRAMGDKIASKKLAPQAERQHDPGLQRRRSTTPTQAVEIATRDRLSGDDQGLGRRRRQGHARRLQRRARRARASPRAATRRKASFGDDRVFIEKFVEEPRHIEIQVLGDAHGNCVYLWERECSIQRRHQKVIEEAPRPFLDEATRKAMGEQAVALAARWSTSRAGTVEFVVGKRPQLLLPRDEHAPAGRASGDRADHRARPRRADDPRRRRREAAVHAGRTSQRDGWAIECRINAEDPLRNFLPSIGRLVALSPPPRATVAGQRARRHRRLRGRRDPDVLRLDDRQADRARRRPRRRRSRGCATALNALRDPRHRSQHRVPVGAAARIRAFAEADFTTGVHRRGVSAAASTPPTCRTTIRRSWSPLAAAVHRALSRARGRHQGQMPGHEIASRRGLRRADRRRRA